jgi:hypothetical protein
MPHSLTEKQSALLHECLAMAQDVKQHADAERHFLDLEESLAADAGQSEVLTRLWKEILAARRSEAFWERMNHAEQTLSDRLTESHIQLKQNYLRLVEEQ